MESNPNGRALQAHPPIWLSLRVPRDASELAGLARAAIDAKTVVDVTASPGLFGGLIGRAETPAMACGGAEIARSPSADVAATVVQAHVIECLCGLGRERLDFYFLTVADGLKPFQIEGAVAALDGAIQEGHVGRVGISMAGSVESARKAFLADSLFQAVLSPTVDGAEAMRPLVESRGGFVVASCHSPTPPMLVPVASAAEVLAATCVPEPV